MKKTDIIRELSARTCLNKAEAKDVIDEFLVITKEALISGDEVYIAGLGTFTTEERLRHTRKNSGVTERVIREPVFHSEMKDIGAVRFIEVFGLTNCLNNVQ